MVETILITSASNWNDSFFRGAPGRNRTGDLPLRRRSRRTTHVVDVTGEDSHSVLIKSAVGCVKSPRKTAFLLGILGLRNSGFFAPTVRP